MSRPLNISLQMLRLHRMCDAAGGAILCSMAVFSPWAFGTTQPWSVWTMNVAGYVLGAFLGVKLTIRLLTGYRNARWERRTSAGRGLIRTLAAITVVMVTYCLISAWNSRSVYDSANSSLVYLKCISWLPHSYDRTTSWQAFYRYLALALSFWAARDWFLGKTSAEERAERSQLGDPHERRARVIPERLRLFLLILTINGGLIGVEGIFQRLDGTPLLLFFQKTHANPEAVAQFGPYAYRSNAAQYFNLLWPVSLALWWSLERGARRGASNADVFGIRIRHFLLVCVMIMAACPLVSVSRVGAVVGVVNLGIAVIVIWSAQRKEDKKTKAFLIAAVAVILAVSASVGWNDLEPRFESANMDVSIDTRNSMYDMARPMADASPLFGTGPGTFEPLFQMFRPDPEEYWPAQLHNDWLETLITFGWLGTILIGAALAIVLLYWFLARAIHATVQLALLFWASLAGCLFYARFDFPFQVYSVIFLFLMLCAALSGFSHER